MHIEINLLLVEVGVQKRAIGNQCQAVASDPNYCLLCPGLNVDKKRRFGDRTNSSKDCGVSWLFPMSLESLHRDKEKEKSTILK